MAALEQVKFQRSKAKIAGLELLGIPSCHGSCLCLPQKGNVTAQLEQATTTYIVCLEWGEEFPYDWEHMKVVGSVKRIQHAVA